MSDRIVLPGWLWIVVLIGGPLLAAWLEQYFGASGWAAPVAGLLAIVVAIAKALQEYQRAPDDAPPAVMDAAARDSVEVAPQPRRSLVDRVLFG